MTKLKLYRIDFPHSDYDDLTSAVVFAESPERAQQMIHEWHDNDGDEHNPRGNWPGEDGNVTEVGVKAGVVHTHVVFG